MPEADSLAVLYTVDTETWPSSGNWLLNRLKEEIETLIYGVTRDGEFGARYQAKALARHGLKGVFLVEPLFSTIAGIDHLKRLVDVIREEGHEVGLHSHPEWLQWMEPSPLPRRETRFMYGLSEDEQVALMDLGLETLRKAGAGRVTSFRAGNYAADLSTLRALRRVGIHYDSSYNHSSSLPAECRIPASPPLMAPRLLEGVWEYPITFFNDWPGHARHAQLGACSHWELAHTMAAAHKAGRSAYVIVSHSFELLRNREWGEVARASKVLVRRFERLCETLAAHRDTLRTTTFEEIASAPQTSAAGAQPLTSGMPRTAARFVEQFLSDRM